MARYDCRKCGSVGSQPTHAADCPAADAGKLAGTATVQQARSFLEHADATYVAEGGGPNAMPVRRDLQAAIDRIRAVVVVIDLAAIGGLA